MLAAVLAVVLLIGLAPAASAGPRVERLPERVAGRLVGDLWRTVLEQPGDETNPYFAGGCLRYDHVVTPFTGDPGPKELSCRVRFGTPVLIAGRTVEISTSTAEAGPDASEATLRAQALSQIGGRSTVRFDGRRLPVTKAVSSLVDVDLPATNLFGTAETSVQLVAAGWVTAVLPRPGRHTIVVTPPDGGDSVITHLTVVRGKPTH